MQKKYKENGNPPIWKCPLAWTIGAFLLLFAVVSFPILSGL